MKSDFLVALILIEMSSGQNRPHSTYFDNEDDFDYFLLKNKNIKWAKLFKQNGKLVKDINNHNEGEVV